MVRFYTWLSICLCACASEMGVEDEAALAADATYPYQELVGLYHLPSHADAINLELRADHSFRWSLSGCDTFGGDKGRVLVESRNSIALVPQDAEKFLWIGDAASHLARVQLDIAGERLVEHTESRQTWWPGAVCAICGGNLGPTGQEDCDDPSFF